MTRPDNMLEAAFRLAAASGVRYRLYRDHATLRWKVTDGIEVSEEAFYEVRPDGRTTFHLSFRSRGKEIYPARS